MPARYRCLLRLLPMATLALLVACSGGDGTLYDGSDGQTDVDPNDVGVTLDSIELEYQASQGDNQAVEILARVLDEGRAIVDGVRVAFYFSDAVPAGASLYSSSPETSGSSGAVATLVFPEGYTSSIRIQAVVSIGEAGSLQNSIDVPSPVVVSEPEPAIDSLRLVTSSNTLDSDADLASEGVTVTAIATDAANNLVEGATILFTSCEVDSAGQCLASVDQGASGALLVDQPQTDETGTAQATLTTSGNVRNRRIRVIASSRQDPSTSAHFDVAVAGTSLVLVGPAQLATNSSANYVATLRNSGGFAVSGENVQFVLAPASLELADSAATLEVCASQAPLASLDTGANGAVSYTLSSPSDDFVLLACTLQNSEAAGVHVEVAATGLTMEFANAALSSTDIEFEDCRAVTLEFSSSDSNLFADTRLLTSITRGEVFQSGVDGQKGSCASPVSGVDFSGAGASSRTATVYVSSSGPNGAGPATLSAVHSSGATAQLELEFVSTNPTRVDVSAEPATVVTNGSSTIRAVVRDNNNNLVKNQLVNFNLNDPSGGSLDLANQITDSGGRAEVTYTASGTTSSRDAVKITAEVEVDSDGDGVSDQTLSDTASITVGGDALRISLGTGNSILEPNESTYQLPYAVIVTDSLGNPAPPETEFRLSVRALTYAKGYYEFQNQVWVPIFTTVPPCANEDVDLDGVLDPVEYDLDGDGLLDPDEDINGNGQFDFGEDSNLNGVLDAGEDLNFNGVLDGEDTNGNGRLDPSNIVSVPATIQLDDQGTGQFNLTYAQQYANWIRIELRAFASVSGTEYGETQTFDLPGAASDFSDEKIEPPGNPSPYGISTSCFDTN